MPTRSDRPLRVVHVLTHAPNAASGGIETYVAGLLEAQRVAGIAPAVISTGTDDRTRAAPPWPSFRVPARMPLDLLLGAAGQPRELAATIEASGCDLVHLHHWHQLGIDLVRTARSLGRPVVVTLHDFFAVCPMFFRVRHTELCATDVSLATCAACVADAASLPLATVEPAVAELARAMDAELAAADLLLALSQAQRDHLRCVPRLAGVNIEVLDLPPPAAPTHVPVEAPRRPAASPMRFVTWGGLVPGKGLGLLVEACAQLPFAVEVHHFGGILDADFAEQLRASSTVPLHLHGPFTAALPPELANYDLAVFPSYFVETYGYTVDEAMLQGLPVVVAERGAPPERIGDRGVLFRAGDAADLARALRDAVARLEQLRRGSPRFRSTWPEHVAALTAHYRTALARAVNRRSPNAAAD